MRLPAHPEPVSRNAARMAHPTGALQVSGVAPSACPNPDNTPPGTCYDTNGPVPGRFNCSACCALRGALSWQGGGQAYAC